MRDLISRQETLDRVCELSTYYDTAYRKTTVSLNHVIDALQNLPPAEPERKTGRWLELTNTNHTYVCSICGRMLVNITDGKNIVSKNYPFCHCGADMRGEEE